MLKSKHAIIGLIFLYFSMALALSPETHLGLDTFYYWEWSRHLALSYYDGSPLIAYIIKLATLTFGSSVFALSIIGIMVTILTTFIIYRSARLFLSGEASYIAMLLWLFSPAVTLDLMQQVTYDTPMLLFWSLSIYYTIRYIQFEQRSDLYFIALSLGLMMLSKYSGIILIFALFIFLLTTKYRSLFKTRDLYLAILVVIVLFGPVLIWNYEHQWISFIYQLNTHKRSSGHAISGVLKAIFTIFLPTLNFLLITPVICWKKHYQKASPILYLCMLISTIFLGFYFLAAIKTTIRPSWLTPYFISTTLLAGYCFEKNYARKLTYLLITGYALGSFSIILLDGFGTPFKFLPTRKIAYYHLVEQFNREHPIQPEIILTSGWMEARPLFFLKNQPAIYTIRCGQAENQYALWSKEVNEEILNKTIKSALFIDVEDRPDCINKYFDTCDFLPTTPVVDKYRTYRIYAYYCQQTSLSLTHIGSPGIL